MHTVFISQIKVISSAANRKSRQFENIYPTGFTIIHTCSFYFVFSTCCCRTLSLMLMTAHLPHDTGYPILYRFWRFCMRHKTKVAKKFYSKRTNYTFN